MPLKRRSTPLKGRELISLAQKLARDAERHALLSASLEHEADRLMVAGLEQLSHKSQVSRHKAGPRIP